MTSSIARYLKDFGEAQPALAPAVIDTPIDDLSLGFAFEPDLQPEPVAVDLDAIRAAAFEEGHATALAEAEEKWKAEREKLVASHTRELNSLRNVVEYDIAGRLKGLMERSVVMVAQAVSDQVASVLAPVLEETILENAIEEMCGAIREALLSGEVAVVTVHCSLPLFEKLVEKLGDEAGAIKHVEVEDIDVSVDIDDAVLVSRLSAWSASLKKVLG